MAGTLFGLGLSQRVTLNGLPDAGWLLYVYDSGTSTPAATYADTGLTIALSFPIVADSYGMLPDFWVADGSYRARATNSTGSAVFFDRDALLAIGPSASSGGGGGSTVDPNALLLTGDMFWKPVSGSRAGCVRCNSLTIGSVSSGATERANSDTQSLYEYLWNNFSNTDCPVTSGRGAGATADFTANKSIGTIDMRGRGPFGLDDMGATAAGIISGATTAAAALGQESKVLLQDNLPNINFAHSLAADTNGAHTHNYLATLLDNVNAAGGGFPVNHSGTFPSATSSDGAHIHSIVGTVASGGTDTPLATLSPGRAGTWYIKL